MKMIEDPLQEGISIDRQAFTEFHRLDPRVKKLWLISDLIAYGALLLTLLLGFLVWAIRQPVLLGWLVAGWAIIAAFCLWYSFWRPPRAYRSWGYRIEAKVLET